MGIFIFMNRFFEQTRRLACELADMDWARDAAGITDSDYQNVYKYEEKPTTIVRMTDGEQVQATLLNNFLVTDEAKGAFGIDARIGRRLGFLATISKCFL